MRAAILELMFVLAEGAETDDRCADQLAEIAAEAADAGDLLIADGMVALARIHRIHALELRGEVAALSAAHDGIFHQGL